MGAGHVPPPGAETKIDEAALAYLVAVQTALGTSHKRSVAVVAIVGILRVAKTFGIDWAERAFILRDVQRHTGC